MAEKYIHTLTLSYCRWILPFSCFVMKCKHVRTPKALQILATFLRPERLASLFRRQVAERMYNKSWRLDPDPRNFCMLRMHCLANFKEKNFDKSLIQEGDLYFMTRESDNSSNTKNLVQTLRDKGRLVGFVEDLEDAFMQGGGAGLAKYLATFESEFHVALPYRNQSTSYTMHCDIIWPKTLDTPGVLFDWRDWDDEGRPLREDETTTTKAPLQCMSRKDADNCGWDTWVWQ